VCHVLFQDPAFFRLLTRIDAELAAEARRGRCGKPECAGPLHVADFPRKPRGCPASVREEYSSRLSFTCGWCDARTTPESVRFLGRRVYVALMLLCPPAGSAAHALGGLLSVPACTLRRWRRWWERDFQRTAFWQSVRDRFMPPVPAEALPGSLLERFQGPSCPERLEQLLRFISPLSTASVIK
jgi:hypothetical protein